MIPDTDRERYKEREIDVKNRSKPVPCGRHLDDFNLLKVNRSTYIYICSKHFVGGKGPTPEHHDPISALG